MTEPSRKLYYSISEVAGLTGVKAHVLRYWESEFSTLRPRKTRSGSRRYRQQDIDEILAIKKLLYEEGYRISGARKMRRQAPLGGGSQKAAVPQLEMPFARLDSAQQVAHLRQELAAIRELLAQMSAPALRPDARREKAVEAES